MRLKYILLFLFGLSFSFLEISAQTISIDNIQKVKVNQLSDQQITQMLQKLQSSGVSQSEAYTLLAQKGMQPTEIEALKRRIAIIQSGGKSNVGQAVSKKDSVNFSRDTVKTIVPQLIKKKSPIYGFDFFTNPDPKFEPNTRIATPKSYVLGPDDEVIVSITGLNEVTYTRKISPDGNLQIPSAGLIYLNGFTIEEAYTQLKSKLTRVYPALSTGQTNLTINLGNVRSIRVTVIGEVVKPGTYTISGLSTFNNVLYSTGGPSIRGSLRNIEIIRADKVIRTVDFYSFLQKGIQTDNIRLEDQDVIRFPIYKKHVVIDGEVKRPAVYELRDAETLEDLVNYAGGYSDNAYRLSAKVVQVGEKELTVRDVPSSVFDRFVPKNADSIYFGPILNRFTNRINIEGSVYRPGTFELTPDLSLSQLIKKADGLRDDAFLSNGYIKRTNPNLDKEMVSFDLRKVLAGSGDIPLQREDSIVILSAKDLKDELTITIEGFVRSPGTFIYRKGMEISDIVALANGFTYDAANHHVEVSRIVKNRGDSQSNNLLSAISLNVDSSLNSTDTQFLLEPLDYIYVPRLVNYHAIGNVSVTGEVIFPGDYALQRRDETTLELLERAGGLTPFASLENTIIYRNGTRVDIALIGKRSRSSDKISLMPGDSIIVRREMPFVEVSGSVNNPQLLRFHGRNFTYYINSAGGVKENGRLKSAYVQYANGINKPVGRFLFFKNYPKIEPGSKIIVPEKNDLFRVKIGLGEIGAITSAVTALISLIAILGN